MRAPHGQSWADMRRGLFVGPCHAVGAALPSLPEQAPHINIYISIKTEGAKLTIECASKLCCCASKLSSASKLPFGSHSRPLATCLWACLFSLLQYFLSLLCLCLWPVRLVPFAGRVALFATPTCWTQARPSNRETEPLRRQTARERERETLLNS